MQIAKLCGLLTAAALAAALSSGLAHAVNVGDKGPAFSLPSTTAKQASMADFAGKTLVLFFYTAAFTVP